jgi:hypothetical protein
MTKTFGNCPMEARERKVNHIKMDLRKINCEARICYGKVTDFDISAIETWRMLLLC